MDLGKRTAAGWLLLSALFLFVTLQVGGQQSQAPVRDVSSSPIVGGVYQSDGRPVNGANVLLQKTDGSRLHTTTDALGQFAFHEHVDGRYTISAKFLEQRSAAITILPDASTHYAKIILVTPAAIRSSKGSEAVAFSDEPNFIVSGVTDWTAVGGHGSDATLRTSEDLARATSALKNERVSSVPAFDAVEKQLREALAAAPHSLSTNLALGKYLVQIHAYREALPLLQEASTVSHQGHESEYFLAVACYGLNDASQATLHIQRALAQIETAAYQRLAGEIAESRGDPYVAVQYMQHATRLEPSEENYFIWASELLMHRAVLQAAEIFALGANAYPSSARMQIGLGSALFAEGHYDEAARRLCKAVGLAPKTAESYLLLGKLDEAAPASIPCVQEQLANFLKVSPHSADAHYLYGMSLLRRGSDKEQSQVATLLQKAVTLNPLYGPALLQLGILAAAQKDYPQAIALYQRAIVADATEPEAHYRLAIAYDRTGLREQAAEERALHGSLKLKNAELIEQERKKLKQFLVTLQQSSPASPGLIK